MDKNNSNKTPVLIGIILILVVLLALSFFNQKSDVEKTTGQSESLVDDYNAIVIPSTEDNNSLNDGLVHPEAPGPWKADAVIDFYPKTFSVGQNTITAKVKNLFFEANAQMQIWDGTTLVYQSNIVAAPGTNWMSGQHVEITPEVVTIPAYLQGKTLIVRFLDDDTDGDGKSTYWGTTVWVTLIGDGDEKDK